MIKSDKGELAMFGAEYVLGSELLSIIIGVVNAQDESDVNICKQAFECAKDTGEIHTLIKFAELMKQAANQ